MKTSFVRGGALLLSSIAATPLLQAHPGHDGHELTWDFSHLAAYPLATMGCFASVAAVAWIGWIMLRRAATARVQSLRGSHPSRGK